MPRLSAGLFAKVATWGLLFLAGAPVTGAEMAGFDALPEGLAQLAMNPHVPARKGPWFEGWYYRISDVEHGRSFAVIAASTLPEGARSAPGRELPGYLAILISDSGSTDSPMQVHEFFPERTRMRRTSPDESAIGFEWVAEGLGRVTQDRIELRIPGTLSLRVDFTGRKPWSESSDNWGPEGFGNFLEFLPLHWFVHSLGSQGSYELVTGGKRLAGKGYGHIEKNWGRVFPKAWMWLEGVSEGNEAQLALAGGKLELAGASMTTWLIGYRSPLVEANFQPGQPGVEYHFHADPCKGRFELYARNFLHDLHIVASAPLNSFGKVSIPTERGFERDGGMESFMATIDVELSRNDWLSAFVRDPLLEKRRFTNAALEFGAEYMKCRPRGAARGF